MNKLVTNLRALNQNVFAYWTAFYFYFFKSGKLAYAQ